MRQFKIQHKVVKRDLEISRYFNDIQKNKIISAQEEYELMNLVKAGCQKSRDKLIEANLRFVVSIARHYFYEGGLPLSDLINEGNIALINAIEPYDETKGFRFISFAVWHVRQQIIIAQQNNAFVYIPYNKISNGRISDLRKTFEKEFGREADYADLEQILSGAEAVEMQRRWLFDRKNIKSTSDKKMNTSDTDETYIEDYIESDLAAPDSVFDYEDSSKIFFKIIKDIPKRDLNIFCDVNGIDATLNEDRVKQHLETVAESYQLTRESVRQIAKKTASRLKIKFKAMASQLP